MQIRKTSKSSDLDDSNCMQMDLQKSKNKKYQKRQRWCGLINPTLAAYFHVFSFFRGKNVTQCFFFRFYGENRKTVVIAYVERDIGNR